MSSKLSYAIEFVGDMDRAVKFYRDVMGLPLKFQSPDWSEFSTGGHDAGVARSVRQEPAWQGRNRLRRARPAEVL